MALRRWTRDRVRQLHRSARSLGVPCVWWRCRFWSPECLVPVTVRHESSSHRSSRGLRSIRILRRCLRSHGPWRFSTSVPATCCPVTSSARHQSSSSPVVYPGSMTRSTRRSPVPERVPQGMVSATRPEVGASCASLAFLSMAFATSRIFHEFNSAASVFPIIVSVPDGLCLIDCLAPGQRRT